MTGSVIGSVNTFRYYKSQELPNSFFNFFTMFWGFLLRYIEFMNLFLLIHKT